MNDFDPCKYVDVFYGNGVTDRFFDEGLASKWFYIKAQCGNTFPHAALPFGKMSVGPYSGGFSSGYGTHFPNSCGGIYKLGDTHLIKGFSHIHHSGTGGIRYYYNYAVTTPFYGDITNANDYHPIEQEEARPGYYSTIMNGILCSFTVDYSVAVHKYEFPKEKGRILIDFSNDGLSKKFGKNFYSTVKQGKIEIVDRNFAVFSGIFSGIKLYFAVKVSDTTNCSIFYDSSEVGNDILEISDDNKQFGIVFDIAGREAEVRMTYSTISADKAAKALDESSGSFVQVSKKAYATWNKALSVIKIDTDDDLMKEKFYSNLYHSLIKPCDMSGESILGVSGSFASDLATLWDQYKTSIPLIMMCYPEMGRTIASGLINISQTLGKIPCSFGLTDIFPCEEQAKMLGILILCEAYHLGVDAVNTDIIDECVKRELDRDDFNIFLEKGIFDRYTHILDTTDALLDVATITKDNQFKSKILSLANNWRNAYSSDGCLSDNSEYYEGDRYTYSFRIQANMEERISLVGEKRDFAKLLDDFFGFNGDSTKPITHPGADKEIAETAYHRFQGFNNECDMESPYAYIFADRHDRLCEIIHECVTRSFGLGKSGLPGNNDSGGLSACFVWNSLGLFPVCGKGEYLIGSPQIDSAEIFLSSGKKLTVTVYNRSQERIYVDKVSFNGDEIKNYRISSELLISGGLLEFYMK